MNQTGWMIVIGLVILAIVVASFLLRGKGDAEESAATTPSPAPAPLPPQTIAAEDTPPAPSVIEVEGDLPELPPMADLAPPPAAPAPINATDGDNLLKLKGVGPKIATLLQAEGVTRYAQIARWSDADIAAIDAKLGSFAGRPTRDNWVDQAGLLAAGDTAGYEAKYGKL